MAKKDCGGCGKRLKRLPAHIAASIRGQPEQVRFVARSRICVTASKCNRFCERLVKGWGVSQVACVDPETHEQTPLYAALEREDFSCPKGLF